MSKIENLKLRKIDGLKDIHLGLGTSPSDCMLESTYNALLDAGVNIGNLYVCGLGYVSYPVTIWGSGKGSGSGSYNSAAHCRICGTRYNDWGECPKCGTSYGSGWSNGGSGWIPTKDYCRWCIWESCFHKAAGLASGSGSGWFSSNPVGSGSSYDRETTFQSYGHVSSMGRTKVSTSIVVPQSYSPRNFNDYPRISKLRIRCCSKKSPVVSFRLGLQKDYQSSPDERSLYGGYAETTFPFSLNYNAATRATVYFSAEDPEGGIFSWELLP